MKVHQSETEPWTVTLIDTGENSMTGGRLRRVREYIGDETFCMTYGDGVGDVDINALIAFHKKQKKLATLTAVKPPGRFGAFTLEGNQQLISTFKEKPQGDGAWINGGFFVLEPGVIDYIADDKMTWEREPMENLARDGQLVAYKHHGFWQPMDTLRDKMYLEELWQRGNPPWKKW
jgi:glucose-1-phosphate cytidylyltransferase